MNPSCLCKADGWKERVWAKRFLLAFRALHSKSPISFSLTPLPPVTHTTGSLKHLLLKMPQTTLNLQCGHLKLQMKRQGPERELHFFEITQEVSLDLSLLFKVWDVSSPCLSSIAISAQRDLSSPLSSNRSVQLWAPARVAGASQYLRPQ